MAKGENIFRRRDGRWEARYIKGRELSGKIKYGYCYGKTYREAKEKAAKRKAALANGAPLPTARTQKPFSSYCLEWLHTKKCTVKESTYIKYSTAVNKHIIPKLGVCHPLGFTTELMDDFIKELQFEDELAPKTVHDILVVLHGILKFASSKFAGSFPAVEINYPKIGKKEMRVLSREEQARFVAYLHEDLDSCRFGILLALCTGIRIGELCALRWESVSTNDKAIRIAKALQRLHDISVSQGARTRIVIGPPKSDTSVRTIPMTEYATGLCRRMKPQSSAAYVLTGTEAFMEPRTLQYRLEKYTQACGLEGVHFHALTEIDPSCVIDVYGNAPDGELEKLSAHPGIVYHGFVSAEQLHEIIDASDILLHVESFDPAYIDKLKYAFSTKIAQCFCAGRCLFSYAPKGTVSTQYLLSTESAVVAAAPDELKNGLALIINNKEIRTEYAKRAKRLATQKHDMASVSRQIKDQVGVILRNEANGSRNIREN